jgi:Mn-dependent DtxR family transcriptional regulator
MEIVNEDLLEKLKQIIIKRQTLSGNKCGTTLIYLANELNIDSEKVKFLLNKLHQQKVVRFREGINSKLIFINA